MSYLYRLAVPLVLIATLPACYHATIETGASPSAEVVEKSFASGWIYGLVPPSTVSTAARCPNGPAKVETQLSFLNGLVRILTLGIYTPMAIKVTCAAPKSDSAIHPPPSDTLQTSARSESDSTVTSAHVPPGMNWVASVSQRLYYPATCAAALALPESDRLYYPTEDGPKRGEFKRSENC